MLGKSIPEDCCYSHSRETDGSISLDAKDAVSGGPTCLLTASKTHLLLQIAGESSKEDCCAAS